MIDFTKYEEVLLEDVADYERAKDGHIYPRGGNYATNISNQRTDRISI